MSLCADVQADSDTFSFKCHPSQNIAFKKKKLNSCLYLGLTLNGSKMFKKKEKIF